MRKRRRRSNANAMERAGSVVVAGNLFWLNVAKDFFNLFWLNAPKVVSLSRSVGLVAKDFFSVPKEWPQELLMKDLYGFLATLAKALRQRRKQRRQRRKSRRPTAVSQAAATQGGDNPGQRTKWHVTLNGGTVVSTDYLRTGGKKGVAYQYEGAVTVRRHFFLSPEFAHAHPLLAEIVRAAAGHRQSKWKMVTTWNSFLERLEQEKGKKTALALTVPEIVRNGIQHRRSGRGG